MLVAAASSLSYIVGSASHGASADAAAALGAMRSRAPACVATTESAFSIANPGTLSRDERLRSRYSGFAFEPEGGWLDDGDLFSYDDLASSMREIASFSRGDVTTGEVIGFEPNGALVDIGVKSSAYCTVRGHYEPRRACRRPPARRSSATATACLGKHMFPLHCASMSTPTRAACAAARDGPREAG